MQRYFSFDRDSSVQMFKNKIREFLQDYLKHLMTNNFLKPNESKTKLTEILSHPNFESRIISNIQIDDSCSLPILMILSKFLMYCNI